MTALFQASLSYEPAEIKSQQSENGILWLMVKLPALNELGLSPYRNEALHLNVEVSHHQQIAVLHNTPVFYFGRSFVPSHFSLETMMAVKMIACLERNFHRGRKGSLIKGRDYYDLLWFMQNGVRPLEEKLAQESENSYSIETAFHALKQKIAGISVDDLAVYLLPIFENAAFIEAWLEIFGCHLKFILFRRHLFL